MSNKLIDNIEDYKVAEPTAYYVSNFITESEEKTILSNIYAAPKPKWTQLSNRRLQNWGGIPHNKGMIAEKIPSWLDEYLERIHKLNLMANNRPNHVLVNEYLAGQGIMPHLDGSLFYPTITTISVGTHTVLKFSKQPADGCSEDVQPAFSFLLEPRSLLVLQDKLFHHYLHCIEEVTEDILDDSVVNLNMCSDKYMKGSTKGVVLCVYRENNKFELTPAAEEVDQKSGGKLKQQLNELSCQLRLGRAFAVGGLPPEYGTAALACVGPREPGYDDLEALDLTKENIRMGVGAGVRVLQDRCCGHIHVDTCGHPAPAAEGAELAAWRFQEFKTTDRLPPTTVSPLGGVGPHVGAVGPQVGAVGPQVGAVGAQWAVGATRARAQNWARFLSDMPANMMTPVDLAQHALDMLCPLGVTVEAKDRDWIETQNMQAFLAVARGSCAEPIFLECSYMGAKGTAPPVLLAAKGVTFDSGGLCLKPRGAAGPRGGAAGAAAVLATVKALAEMKIPINVHAVIPICENMISGQCMKVGDVVRALNGLSIQIEHTDMEGRLMLADALVYGQATYKPALVVDVATLTHGVKSALGGGAYACFTASEGLWGLARAAGARAGDRAWRLPLWGYYRGQLADDPSVDLRNKGAGKATPCLGAAFLKNFVCTEWVHMDITGVGRVAHGAPPYLRPRRMSGRPTRALTVMLEDIAGNAGTNTGDKM